MNRIKTVGILVVLLITIFAVTGCGKQKVIDADRIVEHEGLLYEMYSKKPFTGKFVKYFHNGVKKTESSCRDGKLHGKVTNWYENGQKKAEIKFHAGELVSKKRWDERGNPKPCD